MRLFNHAHKFLDNNPYGESLTLTVFLEKDDALMGEPTDLSIHVCFVPVNSSCGFIDTGWFFMMDGFDELEERVAELEAEREKDGE